MNISSGFLDLEIKVTHRTRKNQVRTARDREQCHGRREGHGMESMFTNDGRRRQCAAFRVRDVHVRSSCTRSITVRSLPDLRERQTGPPSGLSPSETIPGILLRFVRKNCRIGITLSVIIENGGCVDGIEVQTWSEVVCFDVAFVRRS